MIVGGTGGIGSACARLFARAGAKVVIAGRNREKAEEIAREINQGEGEAYAIQVEVTELASVSKMAREVIEELDKIDVLVNAFGVGMLQPVLDVKPDAAKELFDVNVYGTFLVTQTVLRYMATAKQGRIIMFPGILGKHVMKDSSVYSASKFAITGFTKALVEGQRRGQVKFSLLYLGGVDTDFWEHPNIDTRVRRDKMLSTEEVAKAVYYAASQPSASVMNEVVIQPESHQMV